MCVASCAQGHNFKANCLTMINNAFHDLTLPQINNLVIVHLKEGPSVKSPLVRLPKLFIFLQVLQQPFLHYKIIVLM
jgi:hypothetical protein